MQKSSASAAAIIYISTYPPRECGIATFTQDLIRSIDQTFAPRITSRVIAMNSSAADRPHYSRKVVREIDQRHDEDYRSAAQYINETPDVAVVNIQHEYGIFGGELGEKILILMEMVQKPIFLTLHTVLPNPDEKMQKITQKLLDSATGIIVLTALGKETLAKTYSIHPDKISVIPHGIHPVLFTPPETEKRKLNLDNHTILSTFGLLSRNKGIEYVLQALPQIVKKHPDVLYLVMGQTHPTVRRAEGEKYRNELIALADELALNGHVRFYDRYLSLQEILQYLQATDVYIATSLDPHQTVSGTLSYALGSGRAVVSTAFSQAKEVIAPDTGILVPQRDAAAYAESVLTLLNHPEQREEMQLSAFEKTRHMLWSNVALSYLRLFNQFAPHLLVNEKNLSDINLHHIRRLTDAFGMLQFSKLTTPLPDSGYTVDDNARAMLATAWHFQRTGYRPALTLTNTYLRFLKFAQQPDGSWINYYNYDQTPTTQNDEETPADPSTRAVWALGSLCAFSQLPEATRQLAREQLELYLSGNHPLPFLRPRSFFLKGIIALAKHEPSPRWEKFVTTHADVLLHAFEKNSHQDWRWFDDKLTYANGVIPEALLLASTVVRNERYQEAALAALDFLIQQTFQGPIYVPIGSNGWYHRGGERALFDQQPEDVMAMVQALQVAFRITKNKHYHDLMRSAFYWFLGNNLSGTLLYDKKSGGCYDGLQPQGPNLNQGAESTVSYLLARLTVTENKFL